MAITIKIVRGNNLVEFDQGVFDSWCVYLTRNKSKRYAPKDTEYFATLGNFGKIYGHQKIYDDYVRYYEKTTAIVDSGILDLITVISDDYNKDSEEMDIWFTVIYAGMVAEENKENAILKKRIKRLGMHQVLIEGMEPGLAANFSKGKKWRELDAIMKEKGF